MTFEEVMEYMKQPWVLATLGTILVLILFWFFYRMLKKRKLRRKIAQCELKYNESISVPISFKLNKANNIVKANPDKEGMVNEIKADFDDLMLRYEEIELLISDIEDAFAFGKLSMVKTFSEDLEELVTGALMMTKNIDLNLDQALEEETSQRASITQLKERFREAKTEFLANSNIFGDSFNTVEVHTKEIEDLFSTFEEWMFASDYEQTTKVQAQISTAVEDYEFTIKNIPSLLEKGKTEIPSLLDQLSGTYQEAKAQGVFLDHLEIPKNLSLIAKILKEDLKKISDAEIKDAFDSLENSDTRLNYLISQVIKEKEANEEMNNKLNLILNVFDELVLNIDRLVDKKDVIAARFGLIGFKDNVLNYQNLAASTAEKRDKILENVKANIYPATSLLVSVNEINQDIEILAKDFYALNEEVNQANADETRAKKQLMKLYLIINDVELRIKKRYLPSISKQYNHDVERAKAYTRQISDLLNRDIIDVAHLNATVSEAIDFIYQLHNNVNNLVGVVDMCEDAIVYANKYRAFVPKIDSELTKAELAFSNGEYTNSLKMIINVLDLFKPNVSYEELIANNAKSAR